MRINRVWLDHLLPYQPGAGLKAMQLEGEPAQSCESRAAALSVA